MSTGIQASFTRRFSGGAEILCENLRACDDRSHVTVLFGPSGSGKTTILRCLAGLDQPDEGTIQFDGRVWFDFAAKKNTPARKRNIGFVPQDYALFPHLNVAENIAYGLHGLPPSEKTSRVTETMRGLGIEGLERRLPVGLSGGQQQRVALARALARRPRLLLLDEPLSALDSPTRHRLRGELRHWLGRLDIPTLLVTHDRTEALTLGDQIVVLNHGRIEQTGPVNEVFNHPASLSVAEIAGTETVVRGRILESSQGIATVAVGEATLRALAEDLPPDASGVLVCIRAEDVVLTRDAGLSGSARNRLNATVAAIQVELPLMRVELDCGFPLKALVTRQASEELDLQPGTRLVAWIKAPHVHLIVL